MGGRNKEVGLEANVNKTKYKLLMVPEHEYTFERIEDFGHLR